MFFVQQLRDALLADTGFAMHQHARVAVGKRVDFVQQRLHALRVGDHRVRLVRLGAVRAQLQHQLHDHAAQFGAGEVERQDMRIVGRVSRRVVVARRGADPHHGHAVRGLPVAHEQRAAVDHRDADDRKRRPQRGPFRRDRDIVRADHFDVEARHAARDPVDDVGLALPDVDIEFLDFGGGSHWRSYLTS